VGLRATALAGLLAAVCAAPAAGGTPLPAVEAAIRGPCVADPATMRRTHMELLRHQRDRTVHLGERSAPASLQGCIGCHASKTTGSVAQAPTDFCVACHRYTAVQIDCFECHASKPQKTALQEARP